METTEDSGNTKRVTKEQQDIIKAAFLDPRSPSAYSSPDKVYQQCKSLIKNLTKGTVTNVLSSEPEFTQFRRYKRVLGRKTIFRSSKIFSETAFDLLDIHALFGNNDKVKFLAIYQCILSKFLIVIPIYSKTAEQIKSAFDQFYKNPLVNERKGIIIWSDKEPGLKSIEPYLKKKYETQIWHSKTLNSAKSIFAELSVASVSNRIYRYLSHIGKTRYIDQLPNIIFGLNNQKKKELNGMTPEFLAHSPESMRKLLKQKIQEEIQREKDTNRKTPEYRIGDSVLAKNWPPSLFRKNFLPKFQPQPRKIVGIKLSTPVLYILEGLPNLRFYKQQLSLIKRGSKIFEEKLNKQKPSVSSRPVYKLIKTRLDPDRQTRNGKILSYAKFYQLKDPVENKLDWVDEKTYQSLLEKDQIANYE